MTETSRVDEVRYAPSLCAVFQQTAQERPDATALRSSDGRLELTWGEYGERVRRIAAGFAALGVRRGDTVALMLTNRPEFHLVDTAIAHLGATPFSVYNTSSPEQIDYLFATAGNQIVVAEEQFLDRLRKAGEERGIERIVSVDGSAEGVLTLDQVEAGGAPDFDFGSTWRSVGRDDVATLIFTSGTTGPAKAVETSHANVLFAIACILNFPAALGGSLRGGSVLSFLPDAHMANRLFANYLPIATGATIVTVREARAALSVAREVRPTMFVSVPMIWYRIKAAIEQMLANESDERRELATQALQAGIERFRFETAGSPVPSELRSDDLAAGRQILLELRGQLGLDKVTAGISGGAPIAAETLEFVMAMGVPVLEGWAMSETSGSGTLNPPERIKPGTIGRPTPGTEVRRNDDGELLIRSPGVMKGYRNDSAKTAEAIDSDGWLHTGDIVTIDDDGYLTIVDRKKELIINSAGKNMSPANIENAVKTACSLAGTIVAIGDKRPYVTALITLDPEMAPAFAAANALTGASAGSLASDPQVQAEIQAGVDRANASLSRVEQIKAFTILPSYWLPDSDELTPTMKVKRRVINEKYAAEIEEIYSRPKPA